MSTGVTVILVFLFIIILFAWVIAIVDAYYWSAVVANPSTGVDSSTAQSLAIINVLVILFTFIGVILLIILAVGLNKASKQVSPSSTYQPTTKGKNVRVIKETPSCPLNSPSSSYQSLPQVPSPPQNSSRSPSSSTSYLNY